MALEMSVHARHVSFLEETLGDCWRVPYGRGVAAHAPPDTGQEFKCLNPLWQGCAGAPLACRRLGFRSRMRVGGEAGGLIS